MRTAAYFATIFGLALAAFDLPATLKVGLKTAGTDYTAAAHPAPVRQR